MIVVKSKREIEIMRQAGQIVAQCLEMLKTEVRPGITTADLDQMAEKMIRQRGAVPAFKGYRGFPASICTSVNDQVVHGVPGSRVLEDGDILSIDLGVVWQGFYGDAGLTVPVGEVDETARSLLATTREALAAGLAMAVVGNRLGDISHAVQTYAEARGFSVVRDYCGHGIGRAMHESPEIPNYGPPDRGPELKPGMTLAIEPMINEGGYEVYTGPDDWTVLTEDGLRSAYFEHTVAVTEEGPDILSTI